MGQNELTYFLSRQGPTPRDGEQLRSPAQHPCQFRRHLTTEHFGWRYPATQAGEYIGHDPP